MHALLALLHFSISLDKLDTEIKLLSLDICKYMYRYVLFVKNV